MKTNRPVKMRVLRLVAGALILLSPLDGWAQARRRLSPLSGKPVRKQAVRPAPATAYRGLPAEARKKRPVRTEEGIPRLSLGVVTTGAQVRARLGRRVGLEARYLWDKTSSDNDMVSARVAGARAYLFSNPAGGFTTFGGVEAASLSTSMGHSRMDFKGMSSAFLRSNCLL